MSYSALVGSFARRSAWDVIGSVVSSRKSAHIDLIYREDWAELIYKDGKVQACCLNGETAFELLDDDLSLFDGGVYCLSKEIRDEPYTCSSGWALGLFEMDNQLQELEAWLHSNGYCFGLVINPYEILDVVEQLRPAALLVDCPRSAGMNCEQLRHELQFDADTTRDPPVLITQSDCTERINCRHFCRKTSAAWTGEPIDVYSSVDLCQVAPFNVAEVARVLETERTRYLAEFTRNPTLESLRPLEDVVDEERVFDVVYEDRVDTDWDDTTLEDDHTDTETKEAV
jgi:hypothetical protein